MDRGALGKASKGAELIVTVAGTDDDDAAQPHSPQVDAEERADSIARFTAAGAIAALAGIVANAVRTKANALILDVEGVGFVAEVMQLVTLATITSQLAGGPALTSWIAAAKQAGKPRDMQRGLGAALALGVAVAGLGSIVAVGIAPWALPSRGFASEARYLVALACGGVIASVATQSLGTTLTALGEIRATTWYALASIALTTPVAIALTVAFGLRGQFVGLFVTSCMSLATMLFALKRRSGYSELRMLLIPDRSYALKAATMGGAVVATLYSRQLVYAAVRVALERAGGDALGASYNGNYQASLMIVGVYFDLALSALFTYFAPRIAGARAEGELGQEVDAALAFSLRTATPVVLAAIAFRAPIIHVLYSSRFELAISMLGIQFCGDVLRAVCYVQTAPLLYRGKVVPFLVCEGFFVVGSIAVSTTMIGRFGPIGAAYAYVAIHLPYLFLTRYMLYLSCGVQTSQRRVVTTLFATCVALGLAHAVMWSQYVAWASMPVTLIWAWRSGGLDPIVRRLKPALERLLPGR